MNHVIAVANHKGGVGKTTTAYWLGYHFATLGRKVLLIDLDPQANLTSLTKAMIRVHSQIDDVLLGSASLRNVSQRVDIGDRFVDIVAADSKLRGAAMQMQWESPNHLFLSQSLQHALADIVIIDCPPSAGILTANALVAADHLVIPVELEPMAVEGMTAIMANNDAMNAPPNNFGANLLGAVVTSANLNTNSHKGRLDQVNELIDVLGIIPLRQGMDAAQQFEANYLDVYEEISEVLE